MVPVRSLASVGVVLAVAGCTTAPAPPPTPPLEITLARGSDGERATAAALRRLVDAHPAVERWIFTPRVVIDERSVPHSHPVLTLHTRHLGDDDQLLATFIHEQLHWFVVERSEPRDRAMAEFARLFPDPPDRAEGGASDARSTWLHLIVNDLTVAALTELHGAPRAAAIARASTVYPWVDATVLDDPRVREINRRHGLVIP